MTDKKKNKYFYYGTVKVFDRIVASKWFGETYAVSKKEARSNLEYQFKKQTGRSANSKVNLPGTVELMEEGQL